MNWQLLLPLLATTIVAIGGWFAVHVLTQAREREAEWRKEKLAHYKEYFLALAGMIGKEQDVTDEARKRYAIAFNTVGLFASQNVIQHLHAYQDVTRLGDKTSLAEHDRMLTRLVFAIRQDLGLKPKDDEKTFHFTMIAAKIGTQK